MPRSKARRHALIAQQLDPPAGRFMFAGLLLADMELQDHLEVHLAPASPGVVEMFDAAGQGRIAPETLARLEEHTSIAYLHFSGLPADQDRIVRFTGLLQRLGGIAVEVVSSGAVHEWESWHARLNGTLFDLYAATVTPGGDGHHYYSRGMHHYSLPDCTLKASFLPDAAAELMNQFNFWQIIEKPSLADGLTFSLSADAPHFRLGAEPDRRHEADDPRHNPIGLWVLTPKDE